MLYPCYSSTVSNIKHSGKEGKPAKLSTIGYSMKLFNSVISSTAYIYTTMQKLTALFCSTTFH